LFELPRTTVSKDGAIDARSENERAAQSMTGVLGRAGCVPVFARGGVAA
jgi:hypothetical protein